MSNASRRRRRRRQLARAAKANQIPGTPVYAGPDMPDVPVNASLIDYNTEDHHETVLTSTHGMERLTSTDTVSWINMDGLHDAEQVAALCERFDVHPLWVEDILNPVTRPKAEVLDEQVFVVTRVARLLDDGSLDTEQVSMVLGKGWLLTFQERPGDVWESVRKRLATGAGRVRRMGSDYLMHAMLDAVVDHYFLVLESLEIEVDHAEDRAVESPNGALPVDFLRLKQELAGFRQTVWPTREALGSLIRAESSPITESTGPYFRDLYDHVVQVMDIIDATRERLVGVVELNLALQGQRLNEIMKVLTLVSTVFIPLSFLAGLYGMNFEWMPELKLPWAYPLLLSVMLLIGVSMAWWFRSRKWL